MENNRLDNLNNESDNNVISNVKTEKDVLTILDSCYAQAVDGIPKVSKPIAVLAKEYLDRYGKKEVAAKKMIENQVAKCATSGFITGFGGLISLPIALPANITSVLYVQMRMIACTAYIAGFDLKSDTVQTFVYACLAGISVEEIIKGAAIKIGEKFAVAAIKKIPGEVLIKINQKVGFRLLTKFGEQGIVNIGKMVPVVGAVIGGGIDFAETSIIGSRAYKLFIEGDVAATGSNKDSFSVKETAKKAADGVKKGTKIVAKTSEKAVNIGSKKLAKGAKHVTASAKKIAKKK